MSAIIDEVTDFKFWFRTMIDSSCIFGIWFWIGRTKEASPKHTSGMAILKSPYRFDETFFCFIIVKSYVLLANNLDQ